MTSVRPAAASTPPGGGPELVEGVPHRLVLWVLTVAVTFATGNPNLIPTLVLLGGFLVPMSFVVWAASGSGSRPPGATSGCGRLTVTTGQRGFACCAAAWWR
jgi:hypothetical protein